MESLSPAWLVSFSTCLNQPSQKFCRARNLSSLILSDGNKFRRRQSDKVKIPRSGSRKERRKEGRREGGERSSSRHRQCTPISQTTPARAASRPSVSVLSSFFLLRSHPRPPFLLRWRERVYSQDCRSRSISNSDPRTAAPARRPEFPATHSLPTARSGVGAALRASRA